MSAGSVNRWGYCEICGEDLEERFPPEQWSVDPAIGNGTVLRVIDGGGERPVIRNNSPAVEHANAS